MHAEIHFTNYVPLPDHENVLIKNPSAKMFREVRVVVKKSFTDIHLSSVNKEAATGGYRSTPIDEKTTQVPTETFFSGNRLMADVVIANECWAVGDEILKIRNAIAGVNESVNGVFEVATCRS